MRVLVCGSRDWDDRQAIYAILDGLYQSEEMGHLTLYMMTFTLIEGGAPGADRMASDWAEFAPTHSHNERDDDPVFEHLKFPAKWKTYGKGAGPKRNQQMLDEGKPTEVWAFKDNFDYEWVYERVQGWEQDYNAGGTEDMVVRAKKADVPCYVVSRV